MLQNIKQSDHESKKLEFFLVFRTLENFLENSWKFTFTTFYLKFKFQLLIIQLNTTIWTRVLVKSFGL